MSHLLTIRELTAVRVPEVTLDEKPLSVSTLELSYTSRTDIREVYTLEMTVHETAFVHVLLDGFDVVFMGQTCRAKLIDFQMNYGEAVYQVTIRFHFPAQEPAGT